MAAQPDRPLEFDWEAAYAAYLEHEEPSGARKGERYVPPAEAVARMAAPTSRDLRWLTDALADGTLPPERWWSVTEARKWFVATVARQAPTLTAALFQPMLDAAIDEADPSYNRQWVEPCAAAFGIRHVKEYLLHVVEDGTDARKAGAVNALYWAGTPPTLTGDVPWSDVRNAMPESRVAVEALGDIAERENLLLLETFVANPNVDLRRGIIAMLDLDPQHYPDSHRALVTEAIAIARAHEDEYIRHRVEVQLGDVSQGLAPLPHRDEPAD